MSDQAVNSETAPPGGRLLVGAAVLVFGWLCPLFVPLVLATDLDAEWKTVFSGLLLLGIPELFTLVAMAVLGKAGFHYLRGILYRQLRRLAPPDAVGPTRYRVGLVMRRWSQPEMCSPGARCSRQCCFRCVEISCAQAATVCSAKYRAISN
jgi:hypothetical protein